MSDRKVLTMDEVQSLFADPKLWLNTDRARSDFDAALAAHDAEVRAAALAEQGGQIVPCARCGQRKVIASDALNSGIEVCGRCGVEIGLHELAEQGETEWEYGVTTKWGIYKHPHLESAERYAASLRAEIEQRRSSGDLTYHGHIIKRTKEKAGPWMPVPDTTGAES